MLEIVWLSPFFIVLAPTGLIFWMVGKWMMSRPPRKINQLVGYRTKRSMASQEAWDYAQQYSAKVCIRIGLFEMLLGAFGVFASGVHEMIQIILGTLLVMYACVHLLVVTENELKLKFP